jgi:hypothetical protein
VAIILRNSLITSSEGFFYLTKNEMNSITENELLPHYFPNELNTLIKEKGIENIYNIKGKQKFFYSLHYSVHKLIRNSKEYQELETEFAFQNLAMLNILQIIIRDNYSDYLHKIAHHFPTLLYYHGALKKLANESIENKHTTTKRNQSDLTPKGSKGKNKQFLNNYNSKFLRNESIMEIFYSQKILR